MSKLACEIRSLTKIYRGATSPANREIDLDVPAGVIYGVLGPNGAGKTTLVRQLAGLLEPTSGSIHLLGVDVRAEPGRVPLLLGYFGQRLLALNAHRFEEVLRITGLLRGQSVAQARRQAGLLMEYFGVTELARNLLGRMSGGERRLAGLLATFMGDRRVLILDEPTNDLDPLRRQQLWSYLHERNSRTGTTIIVVSHNLLEVELVAHQAVLIDRGVVAACGTIGDLKRSVAGWVRIELRLKQEQAEDRELIAGLPNARLARPGLWVIPAAPAAAPDLLGMVLNRLSPGALDDFRLVTPSLDDVYLHFTGREVGQHV
ncbi:MAG: ABC transporter ATP-binding protein [bacterium]|nr:ABC transporter ATP-binding protein [bacterium]